MKLFSTLFGIIVTIQISKQNFKQAQITLNDNSVVAGLVFYNTPYQTPQSFIFKSTENSPENIYLKDELKKITIENVGDFIYSTVEISRHDESKNKISYNKNFNLQRENLILEVLVKGTNTLYKYSDEKNTAFFYSGNDNVIKSLLFKEYYSVENENAIVKDNKFRSELQRIACKKNSVNYVKYSESDLLNFFKKANECAGDTTQSYKTNFGKSYLKLVAATNFGKSEFKDYNVKGSYTFGLEFERNMPFLNNAFSFAFAANYTTFDTEEEKTKIHYENATSQIDVALLFRYYPINKKEYKIYLGFYAFNWSSSNYLTRTVFSGNPIEKRRVSQLLSFNNIEAGIRYKDFEVFGLLNISQNYLQRNSASIGLKYNLPFIKQ